VIPCPARPRIAELTGMVADERAIFLVQELIEAQPRRRIGELAFKR
jgi:hypothetical protein